MVSQPGVAVAMMTILRNYFPRFSDWPKLSDYRFIDYATQFYLAVVGLLILIFHDGHVNYWYLLLAGHVAVMLVVHFLIRMHTAFPNARVVAFLRFFYPILLYAFFYEESKILNLMFIDGYLDKFFIRLEERLFGFQPSVRFMEALPYLAVSEFFYMSYFSYYIMISGVGLALYLQNRGRFFHYISIMSVTFYLCYLAYIFLPVVGPLVFYTSVEAFPDQASLPYYPLEFPHHLTSGLFFQIMKLIYHYFESHGAAFPSSHVAVALCTLYFSWRYLPRIRYLHLGAVIFLCLSTVYCRYHYVVDVFAGVAATAMILPLGEYLYRRIR